MHTSRRILALSLITLGLTALAGEAAAGPTFHVDLTYDAVDALPGDGFCSVFADPDAEAHVCSLRAAVMEVNATPPVPNERAKIYLAAGEVYTLGIPRAPMPMIDAASGDLDILRPTYIGVMASATGRAVVDGAGVDRVFTLHNNADGSELNGIEVRNGHGQDSAASAIYSLNASATLRNLDIHANRQASSAGCAVRNFGGDLRLFDTTIRDGVDTGSGMRGLCAHGDSAFVDIVNSAIYRNPGPAIHASGGATITMTSSTASTARGHALLVQDSSLDMQFSTVVSEPGAGVLRFTVGADHNEQLNVLASALSSAGGPGPTRCDLDVQGWAQVGTAWNVVNSSSCLLDPLDTSSVAVGNMGLLPLSDAGGPTLSYPLQPSSLLVDRTPAGACFTVATDQRGKQRPAGYLDIADPRCDVGAIELESPTGIFADSFD